MRIIFIQTLPTEETILKYLKDRGFYICLFTNGYSDNEEDKKYADELVAYSFFDENYFIEYAKLNNYECILAHDSENLMEPLRRMNLALGHGFLHTEEQWNAFMDKKRLKTLLNKYELDTPKLYFYGSIFSAYKLFFHPTFKGIVIKPTDGIACCGLSIIKSVTKMPRALVRAYLSSPTHHFLAESYIKGQEIAMTYVVQNHICKLVNIYDKYKYLSEDGLKYPFMLVSPSKYIELVMSDIDPKIQKIVSDLGINNCTFFLQAIVKDNKVYFLESGLRREGSDVNCLTKHFTNQDFNEFTIDAITGINTNFDINKEDPYNHGRFVVSYDPPILEGTVHKVENFYCLPNCNELFLCEQFYKPGWHSIHKGMFGGLLGSYCFDVKNPKDAIPLINEILDKLSVKSISGKDLLDRSVDIPEILEKY